jgi:5'-methylthioadenosine phosphorylase
MKENTPAIGIIGGSGLYQMEQLRNATEQRIETPFGSPSDALSRGMAEGTAFSRTN